jgi:drug/metabolite transporter (DMT)-like permease
MQRASPSSLAADRADRRGVAIVFGAAAALGTLGVVATLAYREGVPATAFTAMRAALGALILGAVVLARWQPRISLRDLDSRQQRLLVVAIVANGVMNVLLFAGFSVMTVAVVMTLFYTYPVLVTVAMAALGRERVTRLRAAALALAMAGLVLVVGSQVGPGAEVTLLGIALALAAAACQAGYLVVSRDGYPSVPAVQAMSLILFGGMLISGATALLTGGLASLGSWIDEPIVWLAVLLAGTVGAAIPKVLVLWGVRRIGGTRTAVTMLAEPVTAVVSAAIVLGQPVAPSQVLGGAAILVAAALVQRRVPGDIPVVQAEVLARAEPGRQ